MRKFYSTLSMTLIAAHTNRSSSSSKSNDRKHSSPVLLATAIQIHSLNDELINKQIASEEIFLSKYESIKWRMNFFQYLIRFELLSGEASDGWGRADTFPRMHFWNAISTVTCTASNMEIQSYSIGRIPALHCSTIGAWNSRRISSAASSKRNEWRGAAFKEKIRASAAVAFSYFSRIAWIQKTMMKKKRKRRKKGWRFAVVNTAR